MSVAVRPLGYGLRNRMTSFRGHARLVRFDARANKKEIKRLVVKARREGNTTRILYQVVSPVAAAGQAVLIEIGDKGPVEGLLVEGPEAITSLTPRNLKRPFFGSDLRIEDLTDEFLHWPVQEIIGSESMLGCLCRIIESRPQAGAEAVYLAVRSWVCPRMALPLRVQYLGRDPKLTRTLRVERAAKADRRHWAAQSLAITLPDKSSRTLFEGTSMDQEAIVPAAEFDIRAIRAAFRQSPEAKNPAKNMPRP
jgi:hypothetical protein